MSPSAMKSYVDAGVGGGTNFLALANSPDLLYMQLAILTSHHLGHATMAPDAT